MPAASNIYSHLSVNIIRHQGCRIDGNLAHAMPLASKLGRGLIPINMLSLCTNPTFACLFNKKVTG